MAKSLKTYSLLTTSFLLAAAVVSPPAFAEQTAYIDEAAISGWAKDAVTYLTEEGLLKGNENGFFNPRQALTRAEAAVIFTRALNIEVDQMQAPTFEDAKSHWAAKEIAAIQRAFPEVLKGYEDGTFQPDKTITRAEFAKLFVSFFEIDSESYFMKNYDGYYNFGSPYIKASDVIIPFTDHETWAKTYIETFYRNGYVAGVDESGTIFAPEQSVTREMVATFFYRHYYEIARHAVDSKPVLIPDGLPESKLVTTEPMPQHFETVVTSDLEIAVFPSENYSFSEPIRNQITYLLKDEDSNELLSIKDGINLFHNENFEPFEPGNYEVDIYFKEKLITTQRIVIEPSKVKSIRVKVSDYYASDSSTIDLEIFNQYTRRLTNNPDDFRWKVVNNNTGEVLDGVQYEENLKQFVLKQGLGVKGDTLTVQVSHKATRLLWKTDVIVK